MVLQRPAARSFKAATFSSKSTFTEAVLPLSRPTSTVIDMVLRWAKHINCLQSNHMPNIKNKHTHTYTQKHTQRQTHTHTPARARRRQTKPPAAIPKVWTLQALTSNHILNPRIPNPDAINPKLLNPKPLNPKPLDPLNPKPLHEP